MYLIRCKAFRFLFLSLLGSISHSRPAFAEEFYCHTYPSYNSDSLVQVTTCNKSSQKKYFDNAFYKYSTSYATGVDIVHQFGNRSGIAFDDSSFPKIVAFGFLDQTITWDATALANAYHYGLAAQSMDQYIRTYPVSNGFDCNLLIEKTCLAEDNIYQ